MKKPLNHVRMILSFLFILLLTVGAAAQELRLLQGQSQLPLQQIQENIWHTTIDGREFYLLPRETVDRLTEKIDSLKAVLEHRETVIAIKDTLLKNYAAFEQRANEHIAAQQELVETADSLYTGYKSLYKDLKRVVGLSTFSFTAGVGWIVPPDSDSRPVGSVGLGYQNWIALYQVGKSYQGVSFLYRLPLGF